MSILLGSDRAHSGISRVGRLLAGTVIVSLLGAIAGVAVSWWLSPLKDLDLQEWQTAKSYLIRQVGMPWGIPFLSDPADLLPPHQSTYQIQAVRRLPAARLDAFCDGAWQSQVAPAFANAAWYIGGGGVSGAAIWLLLLSRLAGGAKSRDLRRGARLVTPAQLSSLACKKSRAAFSLAGIDIPGDLFYRHLIALGEPGSGKSQLLGGILDQARKRKERVIIFDPGGEFLSTHGQSCDRILNPHDKRTVGWNVLNETRSIFDVDAIANSLIQPDANAGGGSSQFFLEGARIVLSEALKQFQFRDRAGMPEIFAKLATSPIRDLYKWLEGSPAAPFLDPAAKAQGAGIQATINSKLSAWQYLQDGDFSIRDWVSGGEGWLFLTSREDAHASLQPLISLWIEIAVIQLLCRPSNEGERIWVVVDELSSLQKMPALQRILAMGRKYRVAVVLATQNPPQLQAIWGREGASALLGTIGNRAIFRLGDFDAADASAKYFGEAEIVEKTESQNMGARQQGSNLNEQRKTEQIVLASQVQALPDLECYVKLSGGLPPAKAKQKYIKRKRVAEPFQERRFAPKPAEPAAASPAMEPVLTPARTESTSPARTRIEDDFWGL